MESYNERMERLEKEMANHLVLAHEWEKRIEELIKRAKRKGGA
jgi:hypothetical protein